MDFLSRVYLQFTLFSTLELRPKRRRPLAWVTATASPWSPDATPVHSSPFGISGQNALAQTQIRSSYSLAKLSDGSQHT